MSLNRSFPEPPQRPVLPVDRRAPAGRADGLRKEAAVSALYKDGRQPGCPPDFDSTRLRVRAWSVSGPRRLRFADYDLKAGRGSPCSGLC